MDSPTYILINQQHQLSECIHLLALHKLCLLDTEFVKVRTYFPQVGLIQLRVNQHNFIIDGLLDLSEFWQVLLYTPGRQIVMHACSEDVELICHYAKTHQLPPIFDTQVALAYLGYGLQISYQQAASELLGVHIDKSETLSDWLQRPLTTAQLTYAINDVIYLEQIYHQLIEELQAKMLIEYVIEDTYHLQNDLCAPTDFAKLHQQYGSHHHTRQQLMQIAQLVEWRERLAVSSNQPKTFIFKNNALQTLVQHPPRNVYELQQLKDIPSSTVRAYGKIILDLLQELPAPEHWPSQITAPLNLPNHLKKAIEQLVAQTSTQTGVPTVVLMRKKWLLNLLDVLSASNIDGDKQLDGLRHHPQMSVYLSGWRWQVLTMPLIALLAPNLQTSTNS